MDHFRISAQAEFPSRNPDTALRKLLQERRLLHVFFLDENGERCVFRERKWALYNTGNAILQVFSFSLAS
jgi:hypothetical protein